MVFRNYTCLVVCYFIIGILFAQSDGDYRSLGSGNWNVVATWERFNGTLMDWEAAVSAPTSTDNVISIRDGHSVTVNSSVTADQLIVDEGGTLIITANLTLANGTGDDLVVNGNLTVQSGGLLGALASARITSGGTCTVSTSSTKSISVTCVNEGSMDWQDGNIGISSFTNEGTISINGNNQMTPGGGNLVNNGKIVKISSGTSQFTGTVSNADTIQINAGTWSSNHFNQNAGGVILGNGNFSHSGTCTLNIDTEFPASLIFSSTGNIAGAGNLTINNDYTIGSNLSGGALIVNGDVTWSSGSLGRAFTNQSGRTLIITGNVIHTHSAAITNEGIMDWQNGTLRSGGATLTNDGIWMITGNNVHDGFSAPQCVNNGKIVKSSTGTTQSSVTFSNADTLEINGGTFLSSGAFNQNGGGVIMGTATFSKTNNSMTLNAITEIPASLAFTCTAAINGGGNLTINNDFTIEDDISGSGALTINGNTTWNSGTISRIFTNQIGRTLTISTTAIHSHGATLINEGTLDWQAGTFRTAGAFTFTNNGTLLISGNNTHDGFSGPMMVNNGIIEKSSTGTTTYQVTFTNSGTGLVSGVGTIAFSTLTNNGTIAPGLSPGILTLNTAQPLSSNSTLEIEMNGGGGPGETDGHDQLLRNGNLTLNGALVVSDTDDVPDGSYPVVSLTSGVISDSFDVVTLPLWSNIDITSTQVLIIKENPTITCPNDTTVNTAPGSCSAVVNDIDPVATPIGVEVTYALSGATMGNGTGSASGLTFNKGVTTVTYSITLAPQVTCSFTVTVNDVEIPTIDCPEDITVSNDAGECGAIANYSVTGDDNCPGEQMIQTEGLPSGSTFPIGTTTNTFRVTDASGNSMTCSFTVTVNDTELPTIDCPDDMTVSNGTGSCGAIGNYNVTGDDNCPDAQLMQTEGLPSGSTFPIGTTTNTFRVTDASGNSVTCSFTVTVNDTELPTIDCPDDMTVSNGAGVCGAIVNYSVTRDDNCPGEQLIQTEGLPSGSTFAIGTTTNTFRVTDASGNSVTCSFTVTVNDTELPTIDCPDDMTVSNSVGVCGAIVNYSVTGDDNCPGEQVIQIEGLPSGSTFPIGTTINTFRVTDASGNSVTCSFTVTVNDTELPTIVCPDDITISNDAGVCGAIVNYSVTRDDNCPGEQLIQTEGLPSGSTFPIGTTTNTFRVTDASGNSVPCSFTVTVNDTELPTIDCPDDITVLFGEIVNYSVTADDNCPGEDIVQIMGLPSGSTFPLGMTVNVFEVTDQSGNTNSCAFTVTVIEDDTCDPPAGSPCDDSDACTVNDVIGFDCNCSGTFEDSDGDGVCDALDGCPDDPDKTEPGICGCGVADTDSDGDATEDCIDGCPDDPAKTEPGICGCGVADDDSDGDGTADCMDDCPDDPDKTEPGICGCGIADDDIDGDGTADCLDGCPDDPGKTEPGICGCGVADTDSDGDGTADCIDDCPDDPGKIEPGDCGCGIAESDSDGDGTADCNDGCPDDPDKTVPGQCGCGVADTDSDNDGTADCNDECPDDPAKTDPSICGCGNPEPGTACNDGNPNTIGDVINDNCLCEGVPIGETCNDGMQNGDEEGIDCGGSCAPCPPPQAICTIVTVYVDPNAPVYDGPGSNNVWWIPVEDLDAGSTSSSLSPSLTVRRYLSTIPFNWTTQGACIDATPNTIYNNRDQGTIYRTCLPVINADFNKWKNYQLRISDQFGSDDCYGKVRVIPQTQSLAVTTVHYVIADENIQEMTTEQGENAPSHYPESDATGNRKHGSLYVCPNPGVDEMQIHWNADADETVWIEITDLAGNRISMQEFQALSGKNAIVFDMAKQRSGMYVIRLINEAGIFSQRWIKTTE